MIRDSMIDFHKISNAIDHTYEAIENSGESCKEALESLQMARKECDQALTFLLSNRNGP